MSESEDEASLQHLRRVGIGGRVQMTAQALKAGVAKVRQHGVITGWGHDRWMVIVQPEDRRRAAAYHVAFWEPEG